MLSSPSSPAGIGQRLPCHSDARCVSRFELLHYGRRALTSPFCFAKTFRDHAEFCLGSSCWSKVFMSQQARFLWSNLGLGCQCCWLGAWSQSDVRRGRIDSEYWRVLLKQVCVTLYSRIYFGECLEINFKLFLDNL